MVPSSPSTVPTSGHTRKPTIRDARMTEQLERKQHIDREHCVKHKHIELLGVICAHGRDVLAVNRAAQDWVIRLGQAVLSFHAYTEKEEQKQIERISKERLTVFKADDEEAYMKLIDTVKDTHITHLLRRMCLLDAAPPPQSYPVRKHREPEIEHTHSRFLSVDLYNVDYVVCVVSM